MSTQFVSKHSNYMVVLKPGMEGNRALGVHSVPGLYVKFQDGAVSVKDETVLKMLREHPGYGTEFLEIEKDAVDPYKDERKEIEPAHATAVMKYGHVESPSVTPPKVKITPQMKKILEKEALKMLPQLLKSNPSLLKDLVVGLASEMKAKEDAKEDAKKSEVKTDASGETELPEKDDVETEAGS